VTQALRAAEYAIDYLNSPAAADLSGAACGDALLALGRVQAKLAAARADLLRRFDAADAHAAEGYGSSSAWLAANGGLTKKDARAAVREMRRHVERPRLSAALRTGQISQSWADEIAAWTRRLPAGLRDETDQVLLDAASAGAPLDDLAVIAAYAIERWRQQQPDPDNPDDRFEDRCLRLGTTFGGAAVIRGDLTPECAAAVRAVLEALGKKAGPEDDRTEEKRFHDALQLACTLLLRAKLVPDRAGADTQVIAHIPLSQLRQMPGAGDLEDAWIRSCLGEDGYLAGQDAVAAACDAQTVPVVTATVDPAIVDKMIDLARAAAQAADPDAQAADPDAHNGRPGPAPARSRALSPEAWQALRHAITRLAVDLVSGPAGVAAVLRQGLLDKPWNTPSLPLDIGYSDTIPGHIRRAVQLRDRTCAWPKCDRPAAWCDVHHLRHKADGGETSVANCALACQFHHDVCIHRRGWQLLLHPDGTTEARSPDGRHILRSHAPPDNPTAPAGPFGGENGSG
jgi:hypothetical protein